MLFSKKNILSIITVLLFLGCNNTGIGNDDKVDNKGQVSLNIPVVSSIVSDHINEELKLYKNRAMLIADVVEYEIYDNAGLVQSGSFSTGPMGGEELISIVPGTYTISVDVYNNDVSDIEPVVSGISDSFTVVVGATTPVLINAIPNNPTLITADDIITLNSSDFVITNPYTISDMGSEIWFKYTSSYDITKISVDFVDGTYSTDYYFVVYDEQGNPISNSSAQAGGIYLNGAAGDIYYIGVLYLDYSMEYDNLALDQITLSSSEYIHTIVDLTIEDGTFYGEVLDGLNSIYRYVVTPETEYKFDINSNDSVLVSIYSEDESEVYLLDSFYNSHIFTTGTGVTSLIVEVEAEYGTTSIDFLLAEYVDPNLLESMGSYSTTLSVYNPYIESGTLQVNIVNRDYYPYSVISSVVVSYDPTVQDYLLDIPLYEYGHDLRLYIGVVNDSGQVTAIDSVSYDSTETQISFVGSYPFIYGLSTEAVYMIGSEVTDSVEIYDELFDYDEYFETIQPLDLYGTIISKPENSLLTDADICFEFDTSTDYLEDAVFSLIPDVPGVYTISLNAFDGYFTDTTSITFEVYTENEGVLNVTFE